MKDIPNAIVWHFHCNELEKKQYIKSLDFLKENTDCNLVIISAQNGIQFGNMEQSHEMVRELVEHAHELGIKIGLHISPLEGFFNVVYASGKTFHEDQVQVFPIPDPQKSEAIVNDYEELADENGYVQFTHNAKWGRNKIMPIYSKVVAAYAFDKTGLDEYRKESLVDVTKFVRIINNRTNSMTFEMELGKEFAGKTVFAMVAQHYNYTETADAHWLQHKKLMDDYSDIPLDGFVMDEYGYIFLNTADVSSGKEEPFRGRMYSNGMRETYAEKWGLDLNRLLFDMRYCPAGDMAVRIKAINLYFEKLRYFPLQIEKNVYEYAKKIYGKDTYVGCHNTFHNWLDCDEVWHTACNWWDIPRDYAHTDEDIPFPVRTGIMLAKNSLVNLDMYYSRNFEDHYNHIIEGAPFNTREFHHAFHDFYWGSSFTEPELLTTVHSLDKKISLLNEFQTEYPKMDLLIVYGTSAQNNWYPDYNARNIWDIDGTLDIQQNSEKIWNAGYRCALVPDYAIEDGRITLDGNKICFNGYAFTHCLFMYPKYAKKDTYAFLNRAAQQGLRLVCIGQGDTDFDGEAATLNARCFDKFDMSILEEIGCPRRIIEDGCEYTDGSFAIVNRGLIEDLAKPFDFTVGESHFTGVCTGLLAYREGECAFASKGSILSKNGCEIKLDILL